MSEKQPNPVTLMQVPDEVVRDLTEALKDCSPKDPAVLEIIKNNAQLRKSIVNMDLWTSTGVLTEIAVQHRFGLLYADACQDPEYLYNPYADVEGFITRDFSFRRTGHDGLEISEAASHPISEIDLLLYSRIFKVPMIGEVKARAVWNLDNYLWQHKIPPRKESSSVQSTIARVYAACVGLARYPQEDVILPHIMDIMVLPHDTILPNNFTAQRRYLEMGGAFVPLPQTLDKIREQVGEILPQIQQNKKIFLNNLDLN